MTKYTNQFSGVVLLAMGVIIGSIFTPSFRNNATAASTSSKKWQYQTFNGARSSVLTSMNSSLNKGYELVELKATQQQGYSTPYFVVVVRRPL